MDIKTLSAQEIAARDNTLDSLAAQFNVARPIGVDLIQELYDAVLSRHSDNVDIIIALGLAFGEHVAEVSGYEWVRVADEYGEETALSPAKTTLTLFPISMLQKRIERHEEVDVIDLARESIRTIEDLLKADDYDNR